MLLEEPADSAGDDMAQSDVTMNEVVSMGGTSSVCARHTLAQLSIRVLCAQRCTKPPCACKITEVHNTHHQRPCAPTSVSRLAVLWLTGERFVVLSKNGSRSGEDVVDGILGSFFGAPMLRSSQFWPRPCRASTSGFPAFQPRCRPWGAPHDVQPDEDVSDPCKTALC